MPKPAQQSTAASSTAASTSTRTSRAPSQYPASRYIIPGSDDKGHYERADCHITPQLAHVITAIYESKKFPFRTRGDLVRWCIAEGVRELTTLEPQPSFMGLVYAMEKVGAAQVYRQGFMSMFTTLQNSIQSYIADGATGEARKLLGSVLRNVKEIEEDYWREKCEKELWSRFGYLLESGQGGKGKVRLISGPEEEEEQ